ncbi:hypothetical protein EDD15DRAFT_2200052 [Pisolithus albus]|nr:hypothetical protein EDD15DRAFT_2200052 [Pisolithus albus]
MAAPNYNNSAHQDAAAAMDIQSVQGTQGSATSTNQCGTSEAMDVEGGDIGSATNGGNGATGNEGTAWQKDEATSKAKAKVQDREEQEHAPVNKGKGREKKMTHGNLNTYAQQYFQLREHNHNKIKQIVQIALSADLGLGFGGKAWPEARKATEGLVKVLQQCSEMSVHHLRAPAEPFKAETEEDLGALYPVDLPDVMTNGEVDMYTGKQEGSGLASLSSLTSFKNNANSLWVMEKNEEQAEKDRATALEKEHQNVKVLQSVRVRRAHLIEEKMRRSKCIE